MGARQPVDWERAIEEIVSDLEAGYLSPDRATARLKSLFRRMVKGSYGVVKIKDARDKDNAVSRYRV